MEKWECKLRLRIGLFRRTVYFTFEWGAWFMAYDIQNCTPDEFNELPPETQTMALSYGAVLWGCTKRRSRVPCSYEQMSAALMRASRADNQKIGIAMSNAQRPEWLKIEPGEDEDEKKK